MEDKFEKIKKICQQRTNLDQKRLNYELEQIKQLGLAGDFYDLYLQKKCGNENKINSLVAFALGITNRQPVGEFKPHKKVGGTRVSPPDIDLDFTDRRRDEVIDYVAKKYGRDRVAQIITFGTMAARAVVRDVGRALGYTYTYCDQIAKMIPFGYTLDQTLERISEFRQIYETDEKATRLIDFAKKLEGVARHASTHACGVVISQNPLDNLVPLQHPTQDDKAIVTQYEMHAIEDLGLLKMDFLGLKNLTIIEDTLSRIYAVRGKSINIEKIPLNDQATFQLLQKGNTVGVFQLESSGMRRYLKQLKPTEFEDIVAMIALYRPGPIGLIPSYIRRKHKKEKIEYLHPKLEPILKSTYGIMVYQEQVMKVAQDLAGFTLAEADVLRKAIGKKIKHLLTSQREKFIAGSRKNGIREEIAQKIWNWIEPFARYSFNRSHAASYATISYQTAFLKAHYPVEFMAALLTSEKNDVERIGFLIEECKKMGIRVLPPDINESFRNFSVIPGENKIRFGLLAIKNVGENVVEAIVKERKEQGPFRSIEDFLTRVSCKDLNKKSLESLIKGGCFDKFVERNQLLENLDRLLEMARETQKKKIGGQRGLFDGIKFESRLSLSKVKPATQDQKLRWEKELLGLYISGHPLEGLKEILTQKALPIIEIKNGLLKKKQDMNLPGFSTKIFRPIRRVRIGGIISRIKKILTRKGAPMLFVDVEDLTDKIEIVVFPGIIEKNPLVFQENKIVFVTGRVDERDGVPKLICEEIEEIINE